MSEPFRVALIPLLDEQSRWLLGIQVFIAISVFEMSFESGGVEAPITAIWTLEAFAQPLGRTNRSLRFWLFDVAVIV